MKIIAPTAVSDTGAFSRASTATYFDAAGVLQTAAVNQPCFDYAFDGGKWIPQGIRIETASTNLVLFSEQLDNAAWSKTRATVTPNAALGLGGTMTADKIVESASSGTHVVYQGVAKAASAVRYSWTVYAMAAERTKVELLLDSDVVGNLAKCVFDLAAGTAGTPVTGGAFSGAAVEMEDLGSGRYRCTLTATSDADSHIYGEILLYAGSESYVGDGASGLYVLGMQLEQGAASSYIPTGAATVTRAADTVTGTGLIYSTVPETDETEWSSVTAYAIGARAMVAAAHRRYEALTANTNKPPASSPLDWLDLGPTNRWRAFDSKIGTVTSATGSMTMVLKCGVMTGLALLGVRARSATVSVFDPLEGVVYSKTYDLQDNSQVTDWHAYFFAPIRYRSVAVVDDLPSYLNGVVTVTLEAAAGVEVRLGALVGGWLYRYAPAVKYGATVGLKDFTRKSRDDFGNWEVKAGDNSARGNFEADVDSGLTDSLQDLLATLTSVPAVYVGTRLYACTVIYGFYVSSDIVINRPTTTTLSIQIEGLLQGTSTSLT